MIRLILTIMLSALAFVSMDANDCGASYQADIDHSLCNLIRGDYSLHESIFRTPDKVGNLYREAECKGRKYDRGGRLLWDGEYHYSYDCEGNLVRKSRREIHGTGGNAPENVKHTGWFGLLFGSDTDKEDGRREKEGKDADAAFDGWQPGDTCYSWLPNGMLGGVKSPDGKEVTFGYDALGRRVSKRTGDTLHRFGWDGNVVLHEWDTAIADAPKLVTDAEGRQAYDRAEEPHGLVTWVYDGTSFTPVAKVTGDERYTIVHDYLGTPTQAYDSKGELVWEMLLDVYGEVAQCHGDRSLVPFRYQGQYEDVETGLYYNRFRYYSPQMGMYISSDPIGLAGGNPTLYGYVFDSNIEIDLLGEKPSKINRHHLIPQEMFRNPDFMNQLKNIGIKDPADFVHRQVSDITEALHKQIHKGAGGGKWNMEFRDWFENNQNFSKKDLQTQIRKMMHNHKIPRSSRNFARKYGRKCK